MKNMLTKLKPNTNYLGHALVKRLMSDDPNIEKIHGISGNMH